MTFDYAGLENTALTQIDEFGRTVVFRSVDQGTFDASTNSRTGNSVTNTNVKAVITDYRERQINDETIRRGDKRVMIAGAALSSAPETNDIIVDGSEVYRIINVETIQPGDTVLLYKLQVRK